MTPDGTDPQPGDDELEHPDSLDDDEPTPDDELPEAG